MVIVILLLQSHFLPKDYSNALPFEHELLSGNEKLWGTNLFYDQILWKWHHTYHENLHYESFSPYSTDYQTSDKIYVNCSHAFETDSKTNLTEKWPIWLNFEMIKLI